MPTKLTIEECYWRHARPTFGCWEWDGATTARGYGQITNGNQRSHRAHRVAWAIATGHTPLRTEHVLHTCDNPPCTKHDEVGVYVVNGVTYERRGHLYLANHPANMADRAAKRREASGQFHGSKTRPERIARGEALPQAKLTEAIVAEIKRRYIPGVVTQQELADEFDVTRTVITRVLSGARWGHVHHAAICSGEP